MPMATSALITLTSFFEILGSPWSLISLTFPSYTSSSASSEACQKNRYGDIVVPKRATNIIAKPALNCTCGTTLAANISSHLPLTIRAVITYANKNSVRYFSTFTYLWYGIMISDDITNAAKARLIAVNGTCENI